MFKIQDGRTHFYQWDIDVRLIVEDPSINEVHFCNRTDNCSLVLDTYVENGVTLVNVPNILLQTPWRIKVYAYNVHYTKFDACFEVVARTKPADYIYTETEIKKWEDMEQKIEEMEAMVTVEGVAEAVEGYLEAHPLEIPEEYVTETELNDKGFATKEELPSVEGLATEAYVDEAVSNINGGVGWHAEAQGAEVFNMQNNEAGAQYAHAEGVNTKAKGTAAHAEGMDTKAYGSCSHAEGWGTSAYSNNQHVSGQYNIADNREKYAVIIGNGTSDTERSNAHTLDWDGNAWFKGNVYIGGTSMDDATLVGSGGIGWKGTGTNAEVFNYEFNTASGDYSHAEGNLTTASGNFSSHSEGYNTTASGSWGSHAEGWNTAASGESSHAEGMETTASGYRAHAEGRETLASGAHTHAEGLLTIAASDNQHVSGRANIEDNKNKYAVIVGNGDITPSIGEGYIINERSNAHTLDWDGNAWFRGNVYVGGTSMDDAVMLGTGGGGADMTNYYTKTQIDAKGYQTEAQVNALINTALSNISVAEEGAY